MTPPAGRGTLVFDDACGFCRRWAAWLSRVRPAFEVLPASVARARNPAWDARSRGAVLFVREDGVPRSGADAVVEALDRLGRARGAVAAYRRWAAARAVARAGYALVARSRPVLSSILDLILGPPEEP